MKLNQKSLWKLVCDIKKVFLLTAALHSTTFWNLFFLSNEFHILTIFTPIHFCLFRRNKRQNETLGLLFFHILCISPIFPPIPKFKTVCLFIANFMTESVLLRSLAETKIKIVIKCNGFPHRDEHKGGWGWEDGKWLQNDNLKKMLIKI